MGAEPARCGDRLSVALSTVRSMLDPGHRHEPDHFVSSDKHLVALVNLPVDVEEFLAAAARVTGRPHTIDELVAAEALYTGDFLEEDAYEDWAVSLREQARAAYFAVARNLVHAAGDAGACDLAVWTCLRVLDRDP
jgi:LuxR family maltose regulon positive regulatory protein